MAPVSFLIPDLGYTGAAKQLSLLAPALAGAGWAVTIYTFGRDGAFAGALAAAGVRVVTPPPRDVRHWVVLRRLAGPVHVFGLPAIRRLWLATLGARRPRVVLSLTGRERFSRVDRRALRLASRILVPHPAAADALVRRGIPSARVAVVPPAVADAPPAAARTALCPSLGIPADAPLVLSAGRMDTRGPLFGSVWAFEFLRYVDPAVRLIMVGDGRDRDRVEAAACGLAPDGSRVYFLGARADVPALVGLADLVVAPQPAGGVNVALEAMAAGRAVLAADTPDLAAVVANGRTGVLTRPGDAPRCAAALHNLLGDPARRQALGAAARAHVRARHSVDSVVRTMETVYRE